MPFKKGQSGNPAGRKKGTKNSATLFKERIFSIIKDRSEDLQSLDMRDLANIASKFVPKEVKQENIGEPIKVNINYPEIKKDGD